MPTYRLEKIPISDIEFGNRYREDYSKLDDLMYSIQKNGQISPIAVCLNPKEEYSKKPYLLVAGGRRLKAFNIMSEKYPQYKNIDAKVFEEPLEPLEFRTLELAENIDRESLSFVEECKLKAEIQELQVKRYGEKKTNNPKGWSMADTAKIFNVSKTAISQDLKLAKAFIDHPTLQLECCRNKTEALKKLTDHVEKQQTAKLVTNYKRRVLEEDSEEYKLINAYIVGDFFDRARKLEDGLFDLIEVDPVLPLTQSGLDEKGKNDTNFILYTDYANHINKVLKECYRLLKQSGWLIIWTIPEPWFDDMYQTLVRRGFFTHRQVGIWYKATGNNKNPKARLTNAYEMFFYARKSDESELPHKGTLNVFDVRPLGQDQKVHPYEKPLTLYRRLLPTFAREGSKVLIPFLGGGNAIIAAHELHMDCYGYDLGSYYKDLFTIKVQKYFEARTGDRK